MATGDMMMRYVFSSFRIFGFHYGNKFTVSRKKNYIIITCVHMLRTQTENEELIRKILRFHTFD